MGGYNMFVLITCSVNLAWQKQQTSATFHPMFFSAFWFCNLHRFDGPRDGGSCIYYLLKSGKYVSFHFPLFDEIFLWHAGGPAKVFQQISSSFFMLYNFSPILSVFNIQTINLDLHNRQWRQIDPEYSGRHIEKWWLSLPSNSATRYVVRCGTNGTDSVRSLWCRCHSR